MKYLILGGTSGIGLEVAKQLSKNNTVCVLGRNFESVNKLSSKNIITLKHEVKSFKELDDFFKNEIYKKYQFDGILNCIGLERFKMTKMIAESDFNEIYCPPVISFLIALKYSSKKDFINDNGSIITMSSVSAVRGKSGMLLYGSARASLESMVKHSAAELSIKGIRVNAVRAGAIETPMHDRSIKNMDKKTLEAFETSHLLGFGTKRDISSLISFLFSDDSKWITGSVITADGGYLAE